MEKRNLKLAILACISFACIPFANITKIFNFLYDKVYYGQITYLFNAVIQILIYTAALIIIAKYARKYEFTSLKNTSIEKEYELPIKNMLILTLITIVPIVIICGLIGWNFKPVYDLGTYFTGLELLLKLVEILHDAIMLILVYQSLRLADEALPNLIKCNKHIPLVGIFLTLTFGIYQLAMGVHYLWYIYIFMGLIFYYLYFYSNKSFSRSYLLMLLIYLL